MKTALLFTRLMVASCLTLYETFHDPDNGFSIFDAQDLFDKIGNLAKQKREEIKFTFKPEKSNVSLRDNQAIYSYVISNIKAANFRIKAFELCELIDNEIQVNKKYDFLFEENIRSFLGYRAKANQRMRETLESLQDAVYFPFLNNGVTIICDELTIPAAPQAGEYLVPMKNPQIVNGLQTSLVLYKMYKSKRANLDNIFVNVRVYETRDKNLLEKITDATNTQTPINYRDKVSTKLFSEKLRVVFENAGIALITKRGDSFSPRLQGKSAQVNIDTVIKYWYATCFERPEVAKDSISDILQEVYDATTSGKNKLRDLFSGDKNSPIYPQMLTAYRIYQKVQSKKESSRGRFPFVVYSDELLAYGIYKLSRLENGNKEYEGYYEKIISLIGQIIEIEETAHKEKKIPFNISGFFKKPLCRIGLNERLGIIEDDNLLESLKNSF